MMQRLRHGYYLFQATVWLTLAFLRAAWYFKTRALHDLALPRSGDLSSREKRRLQHYFYGATYLSVVFCTLRGYPRSRREKHLFTNLAALAYFFDDLVETFREGGEPGALWRDNPEEYGHAADSRGLALHFLHNIYRELPAADLDEFKRFMHRVFNIETAGRQQSGAQIYGLENRDLEKITAEKGGCSVLLFRRVLAHPLSAGEQNALYQFGTLIQLCDDIFDLWHDRQAGTVTLATYRAEQNDVERLREMFESRVSGVKEAFWGLSPGLSGQTGWACVHFLASVTRVCLRHYADLQKKRGTLPLGDRAAMVVDMEKWRNRLLAMRELLTRT